MNRLISRLRQPAQDGVRSASTEQTTETQLPAGYNAMAEQIREVEYSMLSGTTYLDHAGTTPYAKSAIENWTAELTTNLFGNPHSASASSQLSTRRIDDIRLRVLKFFRADPDDFDVVFVANATAAIKIVAEAFRDNLDGFWYGHHSDAHTSLVGCREIATQGTVCFDNDASVEMWIDGLLHNSSMSQHSLNLFAYPGQSNMTGRRLPLRWAQQVREAAESGQRQIYTLLDAASLTATSPLDLSNVSAAPDFVALSFYKIFGFPDLGALIVRRGSGHILMRKHYFAGGTVDAVTTSGGQWHAKKASLHAALEEGTPSFHNIIALDHAMTVQEKLFGSMQQISAHTRYLACKTRDVLSNLRHVNGAPVCEIYGEEDSSEFGPLIAFNLKDGAGKTLSPAEVEKLCIVKGIQLRTGGLCNPGGVARHLGLEPRDIRSSYDAGRRCGEDDMFDGRPTGAIRISFGAMSTMADLQNFVDFIEEYYVECNMLIAPRAALQTTPRFFIEDLSVFPIKSCAAFKVPLEQKWPITARGLAWDRQWCLVHEGTNVALSQKRYPRMALIQPHIDLARRTMLIKCASSASDKSAEINLDELPLALTVSGKTSNDVVRPQQSKVCGDQVPLHVYTSADINGFLSEILGVPCCLARYPISGFIRTANLRKPRQEGRLASSEAVIKHVPLGLANESPILIVSKSSVNELNRQIKRRAQGKDKNIQISASLFRANIVVTEWDDGHAGGAPYIEDLWTSLSISQDQQNSLIERSGSQSTNILPRDPYRPGAASTDSSSVQDSVEDSEKQQSVSSSRTSISRCDASSITQIPPSASPLTRSFELDILGPCQRCQMVSIDQNTAKSQQEPFSTLAKTRRKGDGRVWFGVHASLSTDYNEEMYVQIGMAVTPYLKAEEQLAQS